MGLIIAKFRRKAKSTYDVLECLEDKIKAIEEFGKDTEESRKKILFRFLIFAVFFYLILVATFYFNYAKIPTNWKIYSALLLLLAVPVIIWFIKRMLTWYYNRKLRRNQAKLALLKEEKKKIIDNVMETETYKVAKKILDKFGDIRKPLATPMALTPLRPAPVFPRSNLQLHQTPGTVGLRQRNLPVPNQQLRGRMSFGLQNTPHATISSTPLPMPRNILSSERTVLDKMVDFLIGDGPSNRFALICNKCFRHNGMALKEEFEYLAFACCYCGTFNPARKQRLSAPKLQLEASPQRQPDSSDTSDSEKESVASSDSDKPVITELCSDSPEEKTDFDKLSDLDQTPPQSDEAMEIASN